MPDRAKCSSCGADILWCESATTGALMPIDAEPVASGNVALVGRVAHVRRGDLFEPMLPEGPRYQSHFATCPNAKQWRRKQKKDEP